MFRGWYHESLPVMRRVFQLRALAPRRRRWSRTLRLEALEDRLTPSEFIWSGAVNNLWSNPGNWNGGVAPKPSDSNLILDFFGGDSNRINTNDIFGLTVQQIQFGYGGYNLGGNPITLAGGGISWAGIVGGSPTTNIISFSFSLNSDQHFFSDWTLDLQGPIFGLTSIQWDFRGVGTLRLSNSANSYGGAMVIEGDPRTGVGGTLQVGADNAVRGAVTLILATFDLNGHVDTIGSLAGAGKVLDSAVLYTGADNTSTTFAGPISGPGDIWKKGSGTFTLEAVNTYTGHTFVLGGTLQIGVNNAVPAASDVFVDSGSTFDVHSNLDIIAGLAGGGAVTLGDGGLTTGGNNTSTTLSGVISGSALSTLSKDGTGIFTLAGRNTYTGGTHVNSGTLSLGANSAISSASAVTVNLGATLNLNGFTEDIGSLAGAGNVNLGNLGSLATGINGASTTFSGVISGNGQIVKGGSGTFTLANANTYTGGTGVVSGTLQVGVNNAVPAAGILIMFGGTFDLNGKVDAIGSLQGAAGAVTLGSSALPGALTTGGNNRSTTYSGIISGSGDLIKAGTGTFTLSGTNTYSGVTNIRGGVLQLGANNAIPATSSVTVYASGYPSATLDLNNFNDTIGSLREILFFSGKDFVTLGKGTLTTGGDGTSGAFSGVISGTGGLTKTGTGTFGLYGNNTYSGPTFVQAGTLEVDGSVGNVTLNGGTLIGFGTVGGLTANAGTTVEPTGQVFPSTLHSSNFVNLLNASNFNVVLDSATSYSQLRVMNSGISLGGATLNVTVNYQAQVGTSTTPPDTFTIITATSVLSTFKAPDGTILSNGKTFTASGTVNGTTVQERFQINYTTSAIGQPIVLLTRVAGPVTHFQIDALSTTQAGAPFDFKLTGLDTGNNVVTLFTGTVGFSSQDPYGARLPDNYTFTIGDDGDNGVHTFSGGATLFTAGTWDVTATVLSTGATSSAFVSVTPAPAASFAILIPATSQAGAAFDITVAALDPYGNIDTNYQGTVHFTTTDPRGGQVPADYTFSAADSGVHTFAAGARLVTAGSQGITVSDAASGINGSTAVVVTPAPADHFALSAPAQVTAGLPFDLTVTALDPYGNIDINYLGTVHFSSSDTDPGVLLPADYPFQASDQGVHSFPGGVTLITLGDQTLTATDTQSGINGSATVTVNPGVRPPPPGGAFGPDRPVSTPVRNPTGPLTTWSVQPDPRAASVDQLFASRKEQEFGFRLSRFKRDRIGTTNVLDVFRGEDGLLV